MTRITFVALFIFETFTCYGQVMKINDRNRRIRAGFENSIGLSLDRKFDSLFLRTSQGTFKMDGLTILLIPSAPGQDTIFAKFFYKHKLILSDTSTFAVIKPEIFPSYGAELLKKVNASYVRACGGIIFNIRITDDHWEGASIKSYRFSVIRNDSFVFSLMEYSNKYSDELKVKLNTLIAGDILLISDIAPAAPYSELANCLPGVFEIE